VRHQIVDDDLFTKAAGTIGFVIARQPFEDIDNANDQEPVENPDFTSLHVKGLRKGLDTVNELLNTNGMDRFEAASYFFTLAFHYLSELGREVEKSNAMFEAFEQLGEIRGWCSNVQSIESMLKNARMQKMPQM
jgi:hypothetical protein